jgi:hypothetical protein
MITAVCPNPRCQTPLPVEQRAQGRTVTCPQCRQQFAVAVQGPVADLEATTTPWLPGDGPPVAPPPPARREPPPLPPRVERRGLRAVPTAVSALSVLVIMCSVYGIVRQFRPAAPAPDTRPVAERWAAITIESSGVRLVVVDCTRGTDTAGLALVHATNRAWQLGKLPPDVKDRPAAFDELEKVLGPYNETLAQYGVPPERRLVACNSGVVPESGPNRDKLREWVQASVRKALGLDVEVIDAGSEAEYGARGSVPPDTPTRMRSVSLDMGGSSTKHGYFDTHKTFKGGRFEIGLSKAEARIDELSKARKASFAEAAKLWKPEADEAVRQLAASVAPVANHPRYYLLGGGPWAVTVIAKPAEFAKPLDAREVSIQLTPDDIEAARKLIEESPNFAAIERAVLAKVPAGPGRTPLEVELNQLSGALTTRRMLAGATLLQSFADVCDFRSKEVRFYARSLHAWPVGYILAKGKFE